MAHRYLAFLGSIREGRQGKQVADAVVATVTRLGHEVELIDPLEVGNGLVEQPLHFRQDKENAPQWMLDLNTKIASADGIILVTPEYNSTFPPALAALIDNFPPASYRHKPAAVVAYSMGPYGGIRAAQAALGLCNELGMFVVPSRVAIGLVHTKFDGDHSPNEQVASQIEDQVKMLNWYTEAIKNQKQLTAPPSKQ